MRPAESPAVPVRLGSSALSDLVGPGRPVVIVGDAGIRGRPMHTTVTLDECPTDIGESSYQILHGREDRPVVSPGDSGGPLLVRDREGVARLMGVASTGAEIEGVGWSRWTRVEHVSAWILEGLHIQGMEGRSDAPSCALPPTFGDAGPVGGRVCSQDRTDMCVALGDTGECVLFEYRTPPGNPSAVTGHEWYLRGTSRYKYRLPRRRFVETRLCQVSLIIPIRIHVGRSASAPAGIPAEAR